MTRIQLDPFGSWERQSARQAKSIRMGRIPDTTCWVTHGIMTLTGSQQLHEDRAGTPSTPRANSYTPTSGVYVRVTPSVHGEIEVGYEMDEGILGEGCIGYLFYIRAKLYHRDRLKVRLLEYNEPPVYGPPAPMAGRRMGGQQYCCRR